MRMISVLLSLGLMSGPALAADLLGPAVPYEPVAVPEAFSWTGGYVGLNAGWAFDGEDERDLFVRGRNVRIDLGRFDSRQYEGPFLGAQAGFNFQTGMVVLGIEGDIQWANIDDDRRRWEHEVHHDRFGNVVIHGDGDAEVNWFGTIRGRAGVAVNRALIYGTAGFAFADIEDDRRITFATPGPGGEVVFARADRSGGDDWEGGYALGAGVEYAFTNNFSAKLEYQYLNFDGMFGGDDDTRVTPIRTVPGDRTTGFRLEEENSIDFHTVRLGANVLF